MIDHDFVAVAIWRGADDTSSQALSSCDVFGVEYNGSARRLSLLIDLGGLVASLGALWCAPAGFAAVIAEVRLQRGGRWRYLFRSNGQTFAAKHLEVRRSSRIRPRAPSPFSEFAGKPRLQSPTCSNV